MVTNNDGWVALKYHKQRQVLVRGTPSKHDYVFVVKSNISMAWIRPEDIDNLLNRKIGGCSRCPGASKKRDAYTYATEDEVEQWSGG